MPFAVLRTDRFITTVAFVAVAVDGLFTPPVDLERASYDRAQALAPERRHLLSAAAWAGPREIVYAQAESVVNAAGSGALILRQDVETGRLISSTRSPARAVILDVLARGRVVFDSRSERQNLREEPTAGGPARALTRGNSTDRQPAFYPDGEWVVFSSNRERQLDLATTTSPTESECGPRAPA